MERLESLTLFEKEDIREKHFLDGAISLRIEDVSFSYDTGAVPVLNCFSLVARVGEMIAVMGETGAGKTTLLRLLLALIKPDSGTITIADERRSVSVSEATRSNFVYVPQGNSLFSGSIRDNLLVGDETASDDTMRKALEAASASFVFDFPAGLDTVVGEGSTGLSEGQAQRIAIARSLLRPGKILLLDEATSALDSQTEKNFLRHLKENTRDKIVLFITHHHDVATQCDAVVKI